MDNSIIAVYGSPGSYKTTTALSLARCIASKGSNVVIVGTSTIPRFTGKLSQYASQNYRNSTSGISR